MKHETFGSFRNTSISKTTAGVSFSQVCPLWSHVLMLITPSVYNYFDNDILMFKMHL